MRCPLTVKFGKDVAGLIWRIVWQSSISAVNQEYANTFETSRWGYIQEKTSNFYFNYRAKETIRFAEAAQIYNLQLYKKHKCFKIATIPKHYWEIKELY
jgi:hypothetical protein